MSIITAGIITRPGSGGKNSRKEMVSIQNTWLHVHKQADNSQNPPTLQRVTVYQFSRSNIYEFSNNNNNLYITFGDKNYGHITIKAQNTTYYICISNYVKFSTSRNKWLFVPNSAWYRYSEVRWVSLTRS